MAIRDSLKRTDDNNLKGKWILLIVVDINNKEFGADDNNGK